ncbi:MAG: hypothetical protein QM775_19125 [Pirellulales bacterium]
MLEAVCPNGHRLQVPLEHAGMKLRCPAPGCGVIFQLSASSPTGATTPVSPSGILQSGHPLPPAAPPPPPAAAPPQAAAPGFAAQPPQTAPQPQPAPALSQVPVQTQPLSEAVGNRWTGSEQAAAPQPAPAAPTAPQQAAGPVSQSGPIPRGPYAGGGRTSLIGAGSWTAWTHALLMIGLTLVLTARGCDGLGLRNVARLGAKAELDEKSFENSFEAEMAALAADQAAAKQDKEKADLQKKIDDLNKAHAGERRERQPQWTALKNAAIEAQASHVVWGFWREMLFVAGTIIFALGLLAVGLGGVGVERYFALGILAIIVFSIYVGGVAWFASLGGSANLLR